MSDRHRFGPRDPGDFAPGHLVRAFGAKNGWPIRLCNVMVEGTTDVSYCHTAARLHRNATGLELLCTDFSVFAVGRLDEGGVKMLHEKFRALGQVLVADPRDERGRDFRAIAVFDDDTRGREAFKVLTDPKYSVWRAYDHAYLLKRVMPRNTHVLVDLRNLFGQSNVKWRGMDCEIEDLLSRRVLECFISANPRALRRKTAFGPGGDGHHYDFDGSFKGALAGYVEAEATFADMQGVVELLKSLRYYLKLPPDGVQTGTET